MAVFIPTLASPCGIETMEPCPSDCRRRPQFPRSCRSWTALRAAQLINDPALPIRAITEQLGFPDVSSFGRKFRHWFGDSPARFRRGNV